MKQNNNSVILVYGLIGAVASIAYLIILYVGGLELFTSALSFLAYVIPIVVAVLAALKVKKNQGGYIAFKEALKVTFGVFLIISFISTIFNYLLLYVIDVPFGEAFMQYTEVKMEKMLAKFGSTQEQIDKALEKMRDPSSRSIGNMFLGFLTYAIGWFIVSLIISAIVKKKRPEFENQI
jgi:predicted DNA-binding transcriptional regulator AlpA